MNCTAPIFFLSGTTLASKCGRGGVSGLVSGPGAGGLGRGVRRFSMARHGLFARPLNITIPPKSGFSTVISFALNFRGEGACAGPTN